MRVVHAILLLGGAICLGWLVEHIGLRKFWEDALLLGWGAAIVVVVEGLEHLLHAAAWRRCFTRDRIPTWPHLLAAYFVGYAVSFATPTATVGGELARGGLLAREVTTVEVVASITLDRLNHVVADSTVGLVGVIVILTVAPLSDGARAMVAVGAVLFGVAVGIFFWLQRQGRLAGLFANNRILGAIMGLRHAQRFAAGAAAVDRRLTDFHSGERRNFASSVGLHLAANAVVAIQIAIFLHWMQVPFHIHTVLVVFVVATATDLFSFFIPFRLGAHEGGRMFAMSVAGLDPTLGLLLALVIRLEHVVWATVGLLIYVGAVMGRTIPRAS